MSTTGKEPSSRKFIWAPNNLSVKDGVRKEFQEISMIAGGSGVSPFLQIMGEFGGEGDLAPRSLLLYRSEERRVGKEC